MRRFALALALCSLIPSAAEAACSTATLAGAWTFNGVNGSICSVTIAKTGTYTGKCSNPTTTVSGKLSLSSACALRGTINGLKLVGRTEIIGTKSTLKPNLVNGRAAKPLGPFFGYRN